MIPCSTDFDLVDSTALVPFGRSSYAGLCLQINKSFVIDRAEARERDALCLQERALVRPGADGSFNVSHDSSGRVSSVSWSPSAGEGYSERFSYSNGKLSSWSRSYTGSTSGLSESFSYNSGRISSWSRSYTGPREGMSESFSYNSGRLSSWSRSFTGSTGSQSASISYDSNGNVSSINTTGTGLAGLAVAPCP